MLGQCDEQAKRDKLTLMKEVLKNANVPVKKTHLLYKAGINFHQLDKYLSLLLSMDLIKTIVEPFNGYQITQKGMLFLEMFAGSELRVSSRSITEPIMEKSLT